MKNQSSNPVWRLLRHNVSGLQLVGYGVANIFGLAILLTALQFYLDVRHSLGGDDPVISRDYIIVSKKVKGGLSALLGSVTASSEFTKEEISDLEAQPWCRKVGQFTAAACQVSASVDMGGRGMSTFLFLESIPDEFFDVRPSDWHFSPSKDKTVPIILSKDYLALYNFGFAPSRGLPQISEGTVAMIPLRLTLSGNGRSRDFRGKIVGFSSRLNTIAVPQEFLDWANSEFYDGPVENPSRLIIETTVPGDPAIDEYLSSHDYETSGDKVANGRTAFFLRVLTAVVGSIGAVITLLSFFILTLSIMLLLQKNRHKLRQLMILGYSPGEVARYYDIIVCISNLVVLVFAFGLTWFASGYWRGELASIGSRGASYMPSILGGIGLMILITVANLESIHRKMRRFWYN